MTERNTKFLAEYFHDGSWWSVELFAADFNDAEVICKAHNLKLLGEHKMTIPAAGGTWLPNVIIWLRNRLART
jgi:hypothetical protein